MFKPNPSECVLKRGKISTPRPYTVFATIYDRVMGDALFPLVCWSFESAIRKYRIPFASVADIGCGTGLFLRYLRGYGVQLTGVDRSLAMLEIAGRKNRVGEVRLLQQDITRLALPYPVDLITCNVDTMNYILSVDSLQKVMMGCCENLKAKGHFIFDMIVPGQSRRDWQTVVQKISTPRILSIWLISWNERRGLSTVRMLHRLKRRSGDYGTIQEVHHQRWYPLTIVRELIGQSSFKVRGIHDAETFLPATRQAHWVKFIAQKT